MVDLIKNLLPYGVLVSHIVLAVLALALICRKSWGKEIATFLGNHAYKLGLLVSVLAILGSLFYSNIVGYEPCKLCWWQRGLIYPMAVIFIVAIAKKYKNAFKIAVPLALVAGIIALYQSYTSLGGYSILPCTAVGGACSKVYVKEFGYITIPVMSLTVSVYILLLAWARKIYKNENSNAR